MIDYNLVGAGWIQLRGDTYRVPKYPSGSSTCQLEVYVSYPFEFIEDEVIHNIKGVMM